MNLNIKNILETYGKIEKSKKYINAMVSEANRQSDSLLGGTNVSIPADNKHSGQKGWQSGNAWDIAASIGDPVYAISSGTIQTYNDYGSSVTKTDGKKLFGIGFTVSSDGNQPDVYYTHLKDVQVRKGSHINCGQLLGYVMDFPNSSYDHVHIGVESGHNIREFLNSDGTLKCSKGDKGSENVQDTKGTGNVQGTENPYGPPEEGGYQDQIVRAVANTLGINEEKVYSSFGRSVISNYGSYLIPKNENTKIKSAVDGIVSVGRSNYNCKNQILVKHTIENKPYYLEYCGITTKQVRSGENVSKGEILGVTTDDVTVSLYNQAWTKISIKTVLNKEKKPSNTGNTSTGRGSSRSKNEPFQSKNDPSVDFFKKVLTFPFTKKDDGDPSKPKMWSSPTSKRQPKTGFFFEEKKNKKINESIERIKKLL